MLYWISGRVGMRLDRGMILLSVAPGGVVWRRVVRVGGAGFARGRRAVFQNAVHARRTLDLFAEFGQRYWGDYLGTGRGYRRKKTEASHANLR